MMLRSVFTIASKSSWDAFVTVVLLFLAAFNQLVLRVTFTGR